MLENDEKLLKIFSKHNINESLTVRAAGFIRSRDGFIAGQMAPPLLKLRI